MKSVLATLIVIAILGESSSADAGLLKWAERGAAVCALNSSCRGFAAKHMERGAVSLAERYGPELLAKCLRSPVCSKYAAGAMGVGTGVAAGATIPWAKLDAWMADVNGGQAISPAIDATSQTGSIMPEPEDPLGKPGSKAARVKFAPKQSSLQHALARHGGDWGFTQNINKQVLQQYQETLEEFMGRPDTLVKDGMYKGQQVTHYYNKVSRLWIAVNRADGNIAASWKISPDQLNYLETVGKVSMLETEIDQG